VWLVWTVVAFGASVGVHALASRLRLAGSGVLKFIVVGALVGVGLAVHEFRLSGAAVYTCAALILYAFACELYIFLFTFVSSSVSVSLLLCLRKEPRTMDELDTLYSSHSMVEGRVRRLVANGWLASTPSGCAVTPTGRLLLATFDRLRSFFHPVGLPRQSRSPAGQLARVAVGETESAASSRLEPAVHEGASERHLETIASSTGGAGSDKSISHRSTHVWTAVAVVCVAVALLYPLALVVRDGLTLTGIQEESLGYRYFDSLRILYGTDERPWQPQGQAAGLVHLAIQLALTAAGYPPTQLFPRIDRFAELAIAVPLLTTALAFAWASHPLRTPIARLAFAAAVIAVSFDVRSSAFETLVKPDYGPWVGVLALVATGWLLRLVRHERAPDRWAVVWWSLYAGICASMKPTYAVFALAIGLVLTLRAPRSVITVGASLGAVILALATWVALTWAYYLGSVQATVAHFGLLRTFVGSVGNSATVASWLFGSALQVPPDFTTLAVVLPLALGVACLVGPRRHMSASLLPGSMLTTWFLYQRFTSSTMLDADHYFLMVATVWLTSFSLLDSRMPAGYLAAQALVVRFGRAMALGTFALLAFASIARFTAVIYPSYTFADARGKEWAQVVAETPGTTLFLIPSNEWRFLTVDTAIYKGGTDLGRPNPSWGASPLMLSMFPDRWYLRPHPQAVEKLFTPPYQQVAFVRDVSPSGEGEAWARLQEAFGITPDGFDCSTKIVISGPYENVLCRPLPGENPAQEATSAEKAAAMAEYLSQQIGVLVEPATQNGEFLVRADSTQVDLSRVGRVRAFHADSAEALLPVGIGIQLRFAPPAGGGAMLIEDVLASRLAGRLSAQLGVPVRPAPGETNQFLVRAPQGSVDLRQFGTIDTDLGYAVGLTLPDGHQVGFRFEPVAATGGSASQPDATDLAMGFSAQLRVPVEPAPGETNQFLVRAPQGSVDLRQLGTIDTDIGYAVGLTLPNGSKIGFRYEPSAPAKSLAP